MKRCCLVAGAVVLTIGPVAAKTSPPTSWAKADVSFEQYRIDAVECAKLGYFRDISGDDAAKRFVRGFESGSNALNMVDASGMPNLGEWRDSILRTQPDRKMREIQNIQVNDVETCLIRKGYSKFTLNRRDARQLATYRAGSPARRQFLYQLAARSSRSEPGIGD
jgi:hypothetical protein